jgi:hypothetical protein
MKSQFEVSVSSLPGDQGEPVEPSRWGPMLVAALMLTVAACSAAILIR